MPSTTVYRQGDVVLVFFPFTDLSSSKKRPALVVSPDSMNARLDDLVLVAVTSRLSGGLGTVLIRQSDVEAGMLPKNSEVRIAKLFTLHTSLVVRRLCRLRPAAKDLVLKELRGFFL